MKGRLLLTSALFVFVQIPAQAQVTVDVAKITCQQILKEELASPTHDIVLWLSGYYSGKRNNMTINLQTINNDEQKVRLYCYKTPTRPFWMPSKTCSALINEFTHAANQISKDEARWIAANIAKLPGLLSG